MKNVNMVCYCNKFNLSHQEKLFLLLNIECSSAEVKVGKSSRKKYLLFNINISIRDLSILFF